MPAVLAIDVGARKLGIAVSDETGTIAAPLCTLMSEGPEADAQRILEIVRERGVEVIVAGMPISMSGERGAQAEAVQEYIDRLSAFLGMPVELQDERLTSKQARGILSRSGKRSQAAREDEVAAGIILQAWLDSRSG